LAPGDGALRLIFHSNPNERCDMSVLPSAGRIAGLLIPLLATFAAHAADAPPVRTPGLWAMEGSTGMMAGRMCVGPNEDLSRQRRPDGLGAQCEAPRWQTLAPDRWQMQMVCRSAGTTATHRSEVSGDPQRELRIRMTSHYEPARARGADEAHEMRFTRLGDCPAGVTPGSMVLPNGMVIDPSKAAAGLMPQR
jgi:hypothetical protein